MARSARRAERRPAPRERGALGSGAAALGAMVAANPVLVGGSTAFLVTLFYVSANALWYQPFPHTGAFFATRDLVRAAVEVPAEPETTINIERPEAAPVPVPAPAPKADPVVQRVQDILKDLGFYAGAVDGLRGPATQKAIDAYRQKMGLAAGGIDDALLDHLGMVPATTAAVPRPAPRPQAAAAPDARLVRIQAGLKAFGNEDIKLDGVAGARTRAAIREFQSLFGLPETGEPDQATYDKMRAIGLTD